MDGMELWSSVALEGVPAGSPLVSDDGSYVYLVHNANFKTVGFFTALDAADGAVFYSNSDATTPFSPPGIYHTPFEGNYGAEQGRGNTNDMIMWSATPKPEDTSINDGNTYGFQLPIAVAGNTSAVGYFVLGDTPRTFQAITAPTLTNQGLSAYLSTSRSGFYAWVGNPTNARGRFDGGAVTFGFDRNPTFPGQPVFASPVVSNGVASTPDQPFVFGGTASTQFVRMNFDLSVQTIVDTTSFIQAEARVDPLDRAVYFVEEVGVVHQVAFDTIQDIWTFNLTGGVEGEMALNSRGYVLYVATTTGLVTALQLSEIPITPSPTASPTVNVTDSPTLAPVVETLSPTPSPSASATPPDDTPVPTAADVDGGEAAPTPEPTTAPETAAAPTTTAPEPPADGASQPMILLSLFSMALFLFL